MDSSSDSEDDCYGNIAQKLQSMKNKYTEDKIDSTNLLNDSTEAEVDEIVKKALTSSKHTSKPTPEIQQVAEASASCSNEDLVDTVIASSSKRVTRSKAAAKRGSVDAGLETPAKKPAKAKKKAAEETPAENSADASVEGLDTSVQVLDTSSSSTTSQRGRGRGRPNKRNRGRNQRMWLPMDPVERAMLLSAYDAAQAEESSNISPRGRARGRGRNRARGRKRNSNRNVRMWLPMDPLERAMLLSAYEGRQQSVNNVQYPTYSVGNTDEYPDQSDNQALFSTKKPQAKSDDVVLVEEDNELDENEELSVKVYWQSSEFFKFSIRRYQKLTQIFDYFAKKEGVSNDKLFFTFNDKILKPDDTPDSIEYSIVKFIDGGVVSQSVSKLTDKKVEDKKDGIRLKFQCQNVKKPFETTVSLDEKLSIAMMKCAEHFDTTVDKLKFEFDGDSISGKSTPRELELEGGECIDVRIHS